MTLILENWSSHGQMKGDSVAAAIYEYTLLNFHKSLYHAQVPDDADDRISYVD